MFPSDEKIHHMLKKLYPLKGLDVFQVEQTRWRRHLDILVSHHLDKMLDTEINDWYFEDENGGAKEVLSGYMEDDTQVLRIPYPIPVYTEKGVDPFELLERLVKDVPNISQWQIGQKSNGHYCVEVSRWDKGGRVNFEAYHPDPRVAVLLCILRVYKIEPPAEPKIT